MKKQKSLIVLCVIFLCQCPSLLLAAFNAALLNNMETINGAEWKVFAFQVKNSLQLCVYFELFLRFSHIDMHSGS